MTGVPSVNVQPSSSVTVYRRPSTVSIDCATSFSTSPAAVYDTRPAKIASSTRPPVFSPVSVGINGFCGSPLHA